MLVEQVKEEGVDLAIAWDGDADRCFFIDGEGSFCDGDFVCALLARAALAKEPGATILYDPRSSRAVPDTVAAAGGKSDLSRVGHAFFKIRMRETGAVFGGEVSGHYYFRDFYCADSGTIPALLMLELVSREGRSLSELMAEFRSKYFISGEINSEVADQEAKMQEIAERYSDGEISHLDGVSVDYPDWHFNVRPSNTEPLLRLNLESLVSREDMEAKRDEVLGLIRVVSDERRTARRSGSGSPRRGSACCGSRPRSRSAGSTPTCSRTSRSPWSTPGPTPARRSTSWSASWRRSATGSRTSSW